ncbi:tripartite tricarboxylate transporter family receptor [Variibacter gotjawalensis]|uniref:Tripartite tricarboxylate transporter family receptor n=1 Tax=Variibacter gotjawalensis TaxID=1333996 RepID=A0A0S3PQQ8_9BRAD|nr:tripartite tricarboxylate transporter substrate binding protein [Variibacter gotjawalensis]NIK48545.1 tripartite-type tricarboxylate transporter receptor subunit TctC [Variibacter gotjawalensis]RZS50410.1 tripartite-type tricarboxylate transporter receptor subunit TctC [Variibacter gotjawalensis]BAT58244.1 tripartite tricarboxylate transporter family receptor [Variibacter gotjawalensis]
MKRFIAAAVAATLVALAPANAQTAWPGGKPVTIIVPFAAGGTADIFGRMLSSGLAQKFPSATFIVENRAGAGGNIGATAAARAANDGYTILMGTVSTHSINQYLYKNLPFDPEKDFIPVSLAARLPNMLVVKNDLPVKSVAELIEHLKKNPGKLSYGTSGAGTSIHLASELFQIKTGTKMVHVPYRSSAEIMNALVGGHIDLAFDNITLAWPQAKAGKIRPLAVTSPQRSETAPDVPPVGDTLAGFDATSWHGAFVPAGTPKEIVDQLAAEMKRIFTSPEAQKSLAEIGAVPSPITPAEFSAFINEERKKWQEVVKAANVTLN